MSCNSFWIRFDAMMLFAPARGNGEREWCPLATCAARSPLAHAPPARTPTTTIHVSVGGGRLRLFAVFGRKTVEYIWVH